MATGLKKTVIVNVAEDEDFRVLTKKRYSFNWKTFKDSTKVYKLKVEGEDDILGVMGLVDVPGDKRLEIKLLATSKENIGKNKIYEGIAGCLIAFACRSALAKYGVEACVSLIPKTELVSHYIQKYYMINAGWQLFLEGKKLINLIKEYSL